MCGIAFVKKDKIITTLYNQKDRGLDGVGFVTPMYTAKTFKPNYELYKKFIKKEIKPLLNEGEFVLMHHRKATIGDVNSKNAHPFVGKRFTLMQNGSAYFFDTEYGHLPGETDTEKLLNYIETRAYELADIPEVMTLLKEHTKDSFGNLFIKDNRDGTILFYTDGDREIDVDIDETSGKLNFIGSYKPGKNYGDYMLGYIIFDFEGNILEHHLKEKPTVPVVPAQRYLSRYSCDYNYDYNPYAYTLDRDEEIEYFKVTHYLELNTVKVFTLDERELLRDYLDFQYGVRSSDEYRLQYGEPFPYDGFVDALYDFIRN